MQFTGAVLNGGKSSRMGTDKSVLDFEGQRLIDVSLNSLIEAGAEEVLIIGGDQNIASHNSATTYCKDLFPNEGPLGGIITALTFATSEIIVILACDHMYLTPNVLVECLAQLEGNEVSCPISNGTKQVLCSAWRKSSLAKIQENYRLGNRSVMRTIEEMRCQTFEIHDPQLLRTANTPEELSS
ncbi:MAG: molybdenum cofactor guanylyltransferase [Actinomycetota bacterium]